MRKNLLLIIITLSLAACGQTESNNPNNKPLDKTLSLTKSQKLDSTYFWKIVDYAYDKGRFDNKLKEEIILTQLTQLTPQQIVDFEIVFQQKMEEANTWENFAAHTIIQGGSSDDQFVYFRCWLISLGKKNFYETLKNPDYLVNIDIPMNKKYNYGEVLFEEVIPLSDKAYSTVTKKATEDETFPRSVAYKRGLSYDNGSPMKGKEWEDNKELPKILPLLSKKFPDK